jgi:hypothetical protein
MTGRFMALFLLLASIQGQAQLAKTDTLTKVVIIGVIHSASKLITADSLLNILMAIKPQVVLDESDTLSGYFKKDLSLAEPPKWYKTANKLGLAKRMPPEKQVIYLYRDFDKEAIFHPFDMAIPNRGKYVREKNKKEYLFLDALNKASDKKEFSAYRAKIHENYIALNNQFFGVYEQGYYGMNQEAVTENIRQMMELETTHYPAIIDSVNSMKRFNQYYTDSKAMWHQRNEKMGENILRFVTQYPGKTIVVLTGLLHKYYLIDLLQPKQDKYGFKLEAYYHLLN